MPTPQAAPRTADQVPVGEPLPLRIAFAGEPARAALGIGITPASADHGTLEGAEALAIDEAGPRGGRAAAEELAREAGGLGIPVIGLRRNREAEPAWAGLADLVVGAPGDGDRASVPAPAPVDPAAINPIGFRGTGVAGFAATVTSAAGDRVEPGIRWIERLATGEPVNVFAPRGASLPPLPVSIERRRTPGEANLVAQLRGRLAALDHPAFHASDWERASFVVRLCAAGIPVVADRVDDRLAELVGPGLAAALAAVDVDELPDRDLRERTSVALRRAALRDHSGQASWRRIAAALGLEVPPPPLVSVILSTAREEWIEHGIAQVLRQTYEPRELIVCLHGDRFSDDVADRVRAQTGGEAQVLRIDGELTLGEALNAGVEVSRGDVVTKMDDDDYYTVDHLWDLMLALEYSGADLVGKGAEFVYVSTVDLTIRRFVGDAETGHPRLGGGVMMARREPLVAIGGWPARNRGEDGMLVKNFKASGRRTHRTHGFGYILNRHMRGHTWNTYADYFLVQSQREWRGLRFDVTGIEDGAAGLEPSLDDGDEVGTRLEAAEQRAEEQADEAAEAASQGAREAAEDAGPGGREAAELAGPPGDPP
ncbi:MAG TPA: glycosyltransferase family A protein [Solirubrobacterales bacterium]|nr:glycosyltransferase family A protein [Solirubrobacterales bacterium]